MLKWQLSRRYAAALRAFWHAAWHDLPANAPLDAQVPAAYNAAMRKEFAIIQRITDPAP